MLTSLILTAGIARADVVIPGEERCDGTKQCGKLAIVSCQTAYHGEPTPDCEPYKTTAYRFACESGGATVSYAYYCKLDAPAPATVPDAPAPVAPDVVPGPPAPEPPKAVPAPEPARCTTSPQGGFAGFGVALLFLARRRR